MSRDDGRLCSTCRFCTELDDPDMRHAGPDLGLCRRRAPLPGAITPSTLTQAGRVPQRRSLAEFPIVDKRTMYCFEYQARPDPRTLPVPASPRPENACPNVLPAGVSCMLRKGHVGPHNANGDDPDDDKPRCFTQLLRPEYCERQGDHGNKHGNASWQWRSLRRSDHAYPVVTQRGR